MSMNHVELNGFVGLASTPGAKDNLQSWTAAGTPNRPCETVRTSPKTASMVGPLPRK
jgi:hypothetical protein